MRELIESFACTVLPTDQTSFPRGSARDLAELAGDVTGAFLAAAQESAGYGHIRNDDVIAAGALVDLDRFEPVVDASVAARQPTQAELDNAARNHLLILNNEVSDDYAEHLANDDDGATADTYLEAYVRRLRGERGWKEVVQHRHHETLRQYWLRELDHPKMQLTAGELEAAIEASYGNDDEGQLWNLLTDRWDGHAEDRLIVRLVEGHDNSGVRVSALDCLAGHVPDEIKNIVSTLIASKANGRLAELASDLAHRGSAGGEHAKARHDQYAAMIAALPDDFLELALAERAILDEKTPALSPAAAATLLAIPEATSDVQTMRVRLARHIDLDVTEDVTRILMDSDDHDTGARSDRDCDSSGYARTDSRSARPSLRPCRGEGAHCTGRSPSGTAACVRT
ncbi:hypothetical protein [Mesorhizobium sp.]|uniref:hypothetical protein n=2 Tax=Mesorhizobium sp. TaxID=1871066 RepID=UPI000FE36D28|nr:hypothetical protein [Mesorhizobium sp.]RWM51168.1 MAG: hypothetical protein EOR79_28605 [Mesorhizobium sp.]RWM67331.1 MAG: hypothetical protein EOR81_33660 [Mesorhizobium sp.]RWM88722.1 MAG: hypothetical protein EOR85_34140 [Mesorhizobium sp.]RWN47521.1 MAG: hypothetical protein EOR98_36195 [Mesorhizobium sp.]RWN51633.1 MAG: hypothetical protein EOS00_34060 [Mesorhizobium sp.]